MADNVQHKIVATYNYTDADGRLLFQVCRQEPKGFFQRRPGPHGRGWVYDLRETDVRWNDGTKRWERCQRGAEGSIHMLPAGRALYQLPLLKQRPEQPVLVTEGEKSADLLTKLGYVATCSPGGAGKWPLSGSAALTDRDVVIFADNDPPGIEHAAQVAGSCILYRCKSVRIVRNGLEGYSLPEGGDIFDWLQSIGDPAAGAIAVAQARYEAVKTLVRKTKKFVWHDLPPEPAPVESVKKVSTARRAR